jgi:hypothetical protein
MEQTVAVAVSKFMVLKSKEFRSKSEGFRSKVKNRRK